MLYLFIQHLHVDTAQVRRWKCTHPGIGHGNVIIVGTEHLSGICPYFRGYLRRSEAQETDAMVRFIAFRVLLSCLIAFAEGRPRSVRGTCLDLLKLAWFCTTKLCISQLHTVVTRSTLIGGRTCNVEMEALQVVHMIVSVFGW